VADHISVAAPYDDAAVRFLDHKAATVVLAAFAAALAEPAKALFLTPQTLLKAVLPTFFAGRLPFAPQCLFQRSAAFLTGLAKLAL